MTYSFHYTWLVVNISFYLGHQKYGTDVQGYQPLQGGNSCSLSTPPSCVASDINTLDWYLHGHHIYYINIKVANSAGLVVIQGSSPYTHDVQNPSEGVVLDIDTNVRNIFLLVLTIKKYLLMYTNFKFLFSFFLKKFIDNYACTLYIDICWILIQFDISFKKNISVCELVCFTKIITFLRSKSRIAWWGLQKLCPLKI